MVAPQHGCHCCACWPILPTLTMTSVHQAHSCGKPWMTLFLPEACTEPSSTIRASQHGGIFWVSTILVSPCPVTNVCAVLNNRVLLELSHTEDHVHPRSQRWPNKKTSDKHEIRPPGLSVGGVQETSKTRQTLSIAPGSPPEAVSLY